MSKSGIDGFIEYLRREPTGVGTLDGLGFGLKDLYDIAGRITGCGNPDWRETHPAASCDGAVPERLCGAGAALLGVTHTDELAYSLNGENHHFGAPRNPAAPSRVPGGSSSGSASVTAAGQVDFAIGSDTGGSVRAPAAYCGIYGIRVTHGAVSLRGCMPLAPSYDACGWFARDPEMLAAVGAVLLPEEGARPAPRWLLDPALFALCDAGTRRALEAMLARLALTPTVVDIGFQPEAWKEAFRVLQAAEIWRVHGDWVRRTQPRFGPGVRERFAMAAGITPAERDAMQPLRDHVRQSLRALLADDGVLLLPTAPGPAPVLNMDAGLLDEFRHRVIALTSPAGHAGLPQLAMPAGLAHGAPVSLSMIGPAGSDQWLMRLAASLSA